MVVELPMQPPAVICNILIVDDDPVVRTLLQDHLASAGHRVICVDSASQAMAVIGSGAVQIVVADWLMPVVSGLDLLRWLRGQPLPQMPHFVMLTANTGREQFSEAFAAGVDDFLAKPLDLHELNARLRAWSRMVSTQEAAARLTDELRAANLTLADIAARDDLTGLANRRSAVERLEAGIALADRYGHPLSCAMMDVDHFKQFNDLYGHATGDDVLRHIGTLLQKSTRKSDVSCRIAGDEFLAIFPCTAMEDAVVWSGHFAAELARHPLTRNGRALPISISMGVTAWSEGMTTQQLLESADRALYDAKHAGRGTVRSNQSSRRRPDDAHAQSSETLHGRSGISMPFLPNS